MYSARRRKVLSDNQQFLQDNIVVSDGLLEALVERKVLTHNDSDTVEVSTYSCKIPRVRYAEGPLVQF